MAITISELTSINTIDDNDNIMITHSNGNSEKISGAALKADIVKNKIENNNGNAVSINAVSTILATSTTITGPELGTGGNIKILFTADITGTDTSTGLSITYNSSVKAVKVAKDGTLVDFTAYEVSAGTYKYLQAYTALELIYNGTYFIIVGNPVVLSGADYTIYANGQQVLDPVDSVTDGNMQPVTSNAVADTCRVVKEEGSLSNNGYYIKYSDGIIEQWYEQEIDIQTTTNWGSIYGKPNRATTFAKALKSGTVPISISVYTVAKNVASKLYWIGNSNYADDSNTQHYFTLFSPEQIGSRNDILKWHVVGYWK